VQTFGLQAGGGKTTRRRRLQALQSKALYGGKRLTKLCVQKLCFCK